VAALKKVADYLARQRATTVTNVERLDSADDEAVAAMTHCEGTTEMASASSLAFMAPTLKPLCGR